MSWESIPLYGIAKPKQIVNCVDRELLSVYLGKGVVPFSSQAAKRTNVTSTDLSKYQAVDYGDFVLNNQQAWRGSVGVSKHRGIVSPAYIVLTLSDKIETNYANYLFQSRTMIDQYVLCSKGVGSIQRNIYWNYLKRVSFPLPPHQEQEQIVRYLDWRVSKTNKLISALKKQIGILKEQRKALVNEVVTKGLDPSVPMKDSGDEWIGQIPAHWSVIKLRNILKPVSVKNHPKLPLLSVVRELGVIIRDVEDSESNHNFIPDDLSNYKVVCEGQFAMNKMKAWQGSYGISPYTGIVSPAYYIFDVNYPNKDYFHYAIRSKVYVNFFAKSSDGIRVGQWDLNMQKMKEIPFIVPPASEQDEIVVYIPKANAKIEKAIEAISKEITLLKEYRTRLISDVVTGKVDVSNIEVPDFEYITDDTDDESDDENIDVEDTVDEEE